MNAYYQIESSFSNQDYESAGKRLKRAMAEMNKKMAQSQFISEAVDSFYPAAISPLTIFNARAVGQEAFFKAYGVKCRPLNPAESVRYKGKLAILSKTHDKEEALAVSKRVHEALRRGSGVRFKNGVRVQ
ncbi:MAG: hypothetical protein MK214_16335 [Thalassotalea sp.]|nr:hypothetical protein [Thalassotalea sp.]